MGYLKGLAQYKKEFYHNSVFDQVMTSEGPWCFHVHGKKILQGHVLENNRYEFKLALEEGEDVVIHKTEVKFLYPATIKDKIAKLIKKKDKKVEKLALSPILNIIDRHFIKNKNLYPLMKEKEVLFFTLLEGEIIRGIVLDFTMYDIVVGLKGGIPVTILRHSIYDLKNKAGRCFLKSFQQGARDWKKSVLFVDN